ncbi:hypothetical protein CLOSTASPAR_03806, partial [[Clostridium] asparagiforme DSM 15981]
MKHNCFHDSFPAVFPGLRALNFEKAAPGHRDGLPVSSILSYQP